MKKLLAATLILIIAVPSLLFLIAKTESFDRYAKDWLVALGSRVNVDVELDGFDFDPVGPRIEFKELKLDLGGGSKVEAGPSVVRLHFIRSLIDAKPKMSVKSSSPKIIISRKTSTNEARQRGGGTDSGLLDLFYSVGFHDLTVENGDVVLKNEVSDFQIEINGFNLRWDRGRCWGSVVGGLVSWRGGVENLKTFEFEGRRKLASFEVDNLKLVTDRVDFSGSAKRSVSGVMKGALSLTVDLTDIPPGWIEGLRISKYAPISANLAFIGELSGVGDEPVLEGDLLLEKGLFGKLALEKLVSRAILKPSELVMVSMNGESSFGDVVDTFAQLSWSDGLKLKTKGSGVDYDLRRFMRVFYGDRHFPVGLLASGHFEAEGELYPELELSCVVDGDVRNLDVSTMMSGEPRTWFALPVGKGKGSATVRRRSLDVGDWEIRTPNVDVDVRGGKVDYHSGLEFDTDVTVRNLELVRQYLPEGIDISGRADGFFKGPFTRLVFDYDVVLDETTVMGRPLGRFDGQALYDLETLTVSRGRLMGPGGKGKIEGSAVLLPDGRCNVDLELEGGSVGNYWRLIENMVGKLPVGFEGVVGAKGKVSGPITSPALSGTARLTKLTAILKESGHTFALDNVESSGKFGINSWKFDEIKLNSYGAIFNGKGLADLTGIEIAGELKGFDLARFDELAGAPVSLVGMTKGTVNLWGDYDSLAGKYDGMVSLGGWSDIIAGNLAVAVELKEGVVEGRATAPESGLSLEGVAELSGQFPLTLSIAGQMLPWEELPLQYLPDDISGREVTGSGELKLRLTSGEGLDSAHFNANISDSVGLGFPLGEVGARVDYPSDRGREYLTISAKLADSTGDGIFEIPLSKGERFEASGSAKGIDLTIVDSLFPIVRGRAWGEWSLWSRSLGEPFDFEAIERGDAGVTAKGRIEGLRLSNGATLPPLEATVGSEGTPFSFEFSGENVVGSGEVRGASPIEWNVTADFNGFDPAMIIGAYLFDGLETQVSGRIEALGQDSELKEIDGEGFFDELSYRFVKSPMPIGWRVEGEDGGVAFDLDASGVLRLEGEASPDGVVEGRIYSDRLVIDDWVSEETLPEGGRGTIGGDLDFGWSPVGGVTGKLRLKEVAFVMPQMKFQNEEDVVLSYGDNVITFDSVSLSGLGFELGLTGNVEPGVSVNVRTNTLFDLSLLRRLSAEITAASGACRANLALQGDWDSPVIRGPVTIEPGGMISLGRLDKPFTNIYGEARLEDDGKFSLDQLAADFGDGRIRVEGSVELDGFKPGELKIFAWLRDISYEMPADVTYEFDGDLMMTGEVSNPEVRGEINLKSLLYSRRLNIKTMVSDLIRRKPKELTLDKKQEGVYLDLSVVGRDSIRMDNNVADVDLAVDLRIKGHLPDPEIWGRLEGLGGYFRLRSQAYTLRSSGIEFLGDLSPGVILDIRSQATVQEYTVNLSVTGPIDNYQIDLSSMPPLSRNDLVALLTLGARPENIEDMSNVTTLEATSALTGKIQDELEDQVTTALGFDHFQIDPVYSTASQTTVPRITIGKSVTDSIYARYSAAVGTETEQDFELQYSLSSRFSLLGSWSDKGTESGGSIGGEVRFKVTFR